VYDIWGSVSGPVCFFLQGYDAVYIGLYQSVRQDSNG
jgi:hypothetical protein